MTRDDRPDLTSWKEIAERLQVTVRTAQAWEKKRGLPVRRVPGGGRGRVFVKVHELEAWLDGRLPKADAVAAGPRFSRPATIAATAAAIVLALLAWLGLGAEPPPALWRVVGDDYIVSDDQGEELWRVHFEDGLREEDYDVEEGRDTFNDLDGNDTIETLFVARYDDDARSDELVCFDEHGQAMWRFTPGRVVATGTTTFKATYILGEFRVLELGGGAKGVVVSSSEVFRYPTQVAVISATDGSLISDYWHAGEIGIRRARLKVADLNRDGRSEIYLAGVSNARERATLVVLDPITMQGASAEETDEFQFEGFAPPREIARVLFPRSSMSLLADPYNLAVDVQVMAEAITVGVEEDLIDPRSPVVLYDLRPDFSLAKVTLSSSFAGLHDGLVRDGMLSRARSEEEAALHSVEYVAAPESLIAGR